VLEQSERRIRSAISRAVASRTIHERVPFRRTQKPLTARLASQFDAHRRTATSLQTDADVSRHPGHDFDPSAGKNVTLLHKSDPLLVRTRNPPVDYFRTA
jgi:hypothetical protein